MGIALDGRGGVEGGKDLRGGPERGSGAAAEIEHGTDAGSVFIAAGLARPTEGGDDGGKGGGHAHGEVGGAIEVIGEGCGRFAWSAVYLAEACGSGAQAGGIVGGQLFVDGAAQRRRKLHQRLRWALR